MASAYFQCESTFLDLREGQYIHQAQPQLLWGGKEWVKECGSYGDADDCWSPEKRGENALQAWIGEILLLTWRSLSGTRSELGNSFTVSVDFSS